jgi:hypothetical protein
MENQNLLNIPKYESPDQFIGEIKKMQYISNPLNELAISPMAVVYYGTPCCNLKCCLPCSCICSCSLDCGDNFHYSTLISNNGEQKYLFKNLGRLNCKICSCDRMSRFAYCKSFNLSSYDQFSSNAGTESAEMIKENNCVVCGFCSNFFDVYTRPDNKLAGIVKYKGKCDDCCSCKLDCCCCIPICCGICKGCCDCKGLCDCKCDICHDYFYCCDILSNARQLVYSIYLKRCCISCCPTDCLDSLTFTIKSSGGSDVGNIEMRRNCCNCCGLLGKSCTYSISFPPDATPELKLTIINAVISIDMFGL